MKDHYTEEEVNAILRRAVERQPLPGDTSREQLLALASELKIPIDAIEKAEREVVGQLDTVQLRDEFDIDQRREFASHLASYIGVCSFLVLLNLFIVRGIWWSLFPILGWGLAIYFDAISTFHKGGKEYEDEFRNWLAARKVRDELPPISRHLGV